MVSLKDPNLKRIMVFQIHTYGLKDLLQSNNIIAIQYRMIYRLINFVNPISMHSQSNIEVHGPRSNFIIPINLTIVNPRQLTWPRNWVLTFTLQPNMIDMKINLRIKIEKIDDQIDITFPATRILILETRIRKYIKLSKPEINILKRDNDRVNNSNKKNRAKPIYNKFYLEKS